MKNYKTLEDAINDNENLGKYDYVFVEIGGDKVMLCGTPLVTEDLFCDVACQSLAYLANRLLFKEEDVHSISDDCDTVSELRDNLIAAFENHYGFKIEYCTTEY